MTPNPSSGRTSQEVFVELAIGTSATCLLAGLHNTLQSALADLRFSLGSGQASGNIVLIAINVPSLEKVGVWPWPRKLHAELIDRLVKADAAGIVFDVD